MAEDSSPSLEGLIGTRARDENGRFVSVTPTEEPKEPPKVEATPPKVDPPVITPPEVTPKPVEPVVVTPPPIQAESEKEQAYKKAMQSEREKRQAAEARLRELEQPKKEPIDPWTDLPGALKSEREQLQETLFVERCNLTAEIARQRHTDYDEMQAVFLEAAEADPSLFARLRQERNPAEFAYRHGVLHRELGAVNGDPVAYRTKIETDLRAKLDAEYAAKYGAKPAPAVPASLNSDSSPAVTAPVYEGPPSLKSILRINDSRR
jgi:hypothetical protein